MSNLHIPFSLTLRVAVQVTWSRGTVERDARECSANPMEVPTPAQGLAGPSFAQIFHPTSIGADCHSCPPLAKVQR